MKAVLTTLCALCLAAPATAQTFLFDFGRTDLQTNPGWNNIVPATGSLFSLFDSTNTLQPVGFEITDTFFDAGEPSQGGSEAPVGDAAGYPVTATDDYLFGHVTAFAGQDPNILGQFKLTNLDANQLYNFTFFASRTGINDDRDAEYTVTGETSASAILNATNNNSEVVTIGGIAPDSNNEIFVDVAPGPAPDSNNGFFYLGVLEVNVVPEPTSLALVATSLGLVFLRRRK